MESVFSNPMKFCLPQFLLKLDRVFWHKCNVQKIRQNQMFFLPLYQFTKSHYYTYDGYLLPCVYGSLEWMITTSCCPTLELGPNPSAMRVPRRDKCYWARQELERRPPSRCFLRVSCFERFKIVSYLLSIIYTYYIEWS